MFYVSEDNAKQILEWNDLFHFSDILNDKCLTAKDIGLTPRQIELLSKFDYFDNSTREDGGWRRFNIIEASAIHVIHQSKLYGLDKHDIDQLSRTMLGDLADNAKSRIYPLDRKEMTEDLKRGSGKSAILASILGIPMNLVWSHADPCLSPLFCSEELFHEDFRTKFDSYFKLRIDVVIDSFLRQLAEKRGERYFSLINMLAAYCDRYPWMHDEEKRLLKTIAETQEIMMLTFGVDGLSIELNPFGDSEAARSAELAILSRIAERRTQQIKIQILRHKPKIASPQRE